MLCIDSVNSGQVFACLRHYCVAKGKNLNSGFPTKRWEHEYCATKAEESSQIPCSPPKAGNFLMWSASGDA